MIIPDGPDVLYQNKCLNMRQQVVDCIHTAPKFPDPVEQAMKFMDWFVTLQTSKLHLLKERREGVLI
jgi:hypothetical protein